MPPVMIVVCNNTAVSELVYRWIAGFERETASGQIKIEKGNLEIFRNEDGVQFYDRPNTLLIDSAQLESGEKISDEFKKIFTTNSSWNLYFMFRNPKVSKTNKIIIFQENVSNPNVEHSLDVVHFEGGQILGERLVTLDNLSQDKIEKKYIKFRY